MGKRDDGPVNIPELRDLIDVKVMEIIKGAKHGDWGREEVLLAIEDCLAYRWPKRSDLAADISDI